MQSIHSIPTPNTNAKCFESFPCPTSSPCNVSSLRGSGAGETLRNNPVKHGCVHNPRLCCHAHLSPTLGFWGTTLKNDPCSAWFTRTTGHFSGVSIHPQGFGSNVGPCGRTGPANDGKTQKLQLQIQMWRIWSMHWSWFHKLGMVNRKVKVSQEIQTSEFTRPSTAFSSKSKRRHATMSMTCQAPVTLNHVFHNQFQPPGI